MPGKLLQPVQVLEGVGERVGAEPLEECRAARPRSALRRGETRADRRPRGAPGRGRRRPRTRRPAGRPRRRRPRYRLDEVADAVPRHGDAEPELCLDLVALGHRDLPHVVPEPRHDEAVCLPPAGGGPRPGADPLAHARLGPVTDDGLPHEAHSGLHEGELPVAVRGLVQVHEVHVDLGPRKIAVVLRVEVQERPLEGSEPRDPHLRRGERVHPGDDADARRARVGLDQYGADRLRRRRDGFADDAHRDLGGGVEGGGDLGRVRLDGSELLGAVHVLAPADEPGLELSERVSRHRSRSRRVAGDSSRSSAG